jgi:hypothetical protein
VKKPGQSDICQCATNRITQADRSSFQDPKCHATTLPSPAHAITGSLLHKISKEEDRSRDVTDNPMPCVHTITPLVPFPKFRAAPPLRGTGREREGNRRTGGPWVNCSGPGLSQRGPDLDSFPRAVLKHESCRWSLKLGYVTVLSRRRLWLL